MEIEAKFGVPDRERFAAIASAERLAGLAAGPWSTHEVVDTYLDTEDYRFLRAGYAYRIRQSGASRLLTLKGLGGAADGLHSRTEVEATLLDDESARPAGPAGALVAEIGADRPMHPLFHCHQARRQSRLRRDGQPDASLELSLDQVSVGQGTAFLEVEVEMLPGGHLAELVAAADALKSTWGLVPQTQSKFERGLAMARPELLVFLEPAAGPHGPGVRPDDPIAEACRKILCRQFAIMLANEAGSRSGDDIEGVHEMRVATRRMRAAIDMLGGHFRQKPMRRFTRQLRDAGRALGAVRDLDVFELKARKDFLATRSGKARELDLLLAQWRSQRQATRQGLHAHLDGEGYRRFLVDFSQFLRTPGALVKQKSARLQVRYVLPSLIRQLYDTMCAHEPGLADASVEQLHLLRIQGKYLRYALEFFSEVLGPETDGLVKAVKAMQDHLGDLQDAVVAADLVSAFLKEKIQAGASAGTLAGAVAYGEFRQAEAERLLREFPDRWPIVGGVDFRERLSAVLAAM